MPLTMTRPWKHPSSGIYWLRRAVPDDLRPILKKREERRSLGTRDPTEARQKHAQVLAELEARRASLRSGPKELTEREAHRLAQAAHDRWLAIHRDNPSEQAFWRTDLIEKLWAPPGTIDV